MKRYGRILAIVLAMVMMFSSVSAFAASESSAATLNVNLALYKSFPLNTTITAGESDEISQVVKMQFRYKGIDSFTSIEKFAKNFSGTTISKTGVKWVSSDEDVATVDSKGKITAVKKGSCYVYPVPKGVSSYKKASYAILYLKCGYSNGIKLYGGIGTKVKVTKK